MSRAFKTVADAATVDLMIRLGDCLPPNHLTRFVVDTTAHLALSAVYARGGACGGEPYVPEVLFGLLFYGYAAGVFSARKLEQATFESVPFCFIAGSLHPAPDTLAAFRKTFLPVLENLFVEVLLLAQLAEVLKLVVISLAGTKIHANASKSHARQLSASALLAGAPARR